MMDAPGPDWSARTITPAEVRGWFGKDWPTDELCCVVAAGLTRMRWPSNPPAAPESTWLPKLEIDSDDRYWDVRGVADAARLLRDSMPAMLQHWEGLRWAPETREGCEAMAALDAALAEALPFIEWPFGQYERQTHRHAPKDWHMPAVLIAGIIVAAAGPPMLSIERNSTVTKVVHAALRRMGYPSVTASAIGMHLSRWIAKHGDLPRPPGRE